MKLTPSEIELLNSMIFPESFDRLLEETGMQTGTLRGDLIQLVSHGYVDVYDLGGTQLVSPFYDLDNLHEFAFKATKSGLLAIRSIEQRKPLNRF
jgi:hypothetical protein